MGKESPLEIYNSNYNKEIATSWQLHSQLSFDYGPYSLDQTALQLNPTSNVFELYSQANLATVTTVHNEIIFSNLGVAILSPSKRLSTLPPASPSAPLQAPCIPTSTKEGCDYYTDQIIDWSHLSLDWGGISNILPTISYNEDDTVGPLIYPTVYIWHNPVNGGGFVLGSTSSSYVSITNYNFNAVTGTDAVALLSSATSGLISNT